MDQNSAHGCRQFVELAFERVGMLIQWQGPKGFEERGVLAGSSQAGRTVVIISPHFFRPEEVATQLPQRSQDMSFWLHCWQCMQVSVLWPRSQLLASSKAQYL